MRILKSGLIKLIIYLCISLILSWLVGSPIHLDGDSDGEMGETSNTVPTSTESHPTAIDENSNRRLYEGIPKNELSLRDKIAWDSIQKELAMHQRLSDSENTQLNLEREKALISETEAQEMDPNLADNQVPSYHKMLAENRPHTDKEVLDLTRKENEMRLKESPNDIGNPEKKRKFEE
jgi:hypothetical protein